MALLLFSIIREIGGSFWKTVERHARRFTFNQEKTKKDLRKSRPFLRQNKKRKKLLSGYWRWWRWANYFLFCFSISTVTFTRRRSRSNAPIAAKVSASRGRWPSTAFCTWRSRRTSAPSVPAASTSDPTSRRISWPTRTWNRTSARRAAKSSDATAICAATPWLTPSAMWAPKAKATTRRSIRPDWSASRRPAAVCSSIPTGRPTRKPDLAAPSRPWITSIHRRTRQTLAIRSSQSHRRQCRPLPQLRYSARRKQPQPRRRRPLLLPRNRPSTLSLQSICSHPQQHLQQCVLWPGRPASA